MCYVSYLILGPDNDQIIFSLCLNEANLKKVYPWITLMHHEALCETTFCVESLVMTETKASIKYLVLFSTHCDWISF